MPFNRLVLTAALLLPLLVAGQYHFTGAWYGRAEAKTGLTYNSYLCELVILKKGNKISGKLNYYFGADSYSAPISGTFWPQTGTIELLPFKLISFFARDSNAPDCLMDGSLTLYTDNEDSTLYGQLNPVNEYRYGCPIMTVRLQKERNLPAGARLLAGAPLPAGSQQADKRTQLPQASEAKAQPLRMPADISALQQRSFVPGPLIEVDSDSVELHLYDNGKVDGDTVSVFFNRQPLASRLALGATPVVLRLVLQPGENEVAMFAENLGEIPPQYSPLSAIRSGPAVRYQPHQQHGQQWYHQGTAAPASRPVAQGLVIIVISLFRVLNFIWLWLFHKPTATTSRPEHLFLPLVLPMSIDITPGALLKKIDSPADLKKLSREQLHQMCTELRQYIIDVVSVHGGHFGASLGVVELSVALHYVYNTPYDQLVWDVGHQAYGHKILTGRRDIFPSNRKYKGLSGFPKRSESEYDTFGVGHSSTSISAALGMAMAAKYKGEDRKSVAVIGDGAMTAGMAFEAMNHAGVADADVLIILNDNCMSIDPNVGALKEYLTDISLSPTYNKLKDDVWKALDKLPVGKNFTKSMAHKLADGLKGAISSSANLFEALKLRYFGPIDGHNIAKLVDTLEDLKKIPGPKILHIVTVKGKGYALAEKDQTKWHAPGLFDKVTGEIVKKKFETPQPPKYQDVFGQTMIELAELNPKVWGVTPAMPSGSSLKFMMEKMPDRAIDVGICEQHAATVSAGLATQGMRVFCNIYSSFMQRAYDQVVHDIAIQKLPVTLCLDRAGLVGEDGPTHHGAYDIPYFRCIPNMIISAPMNEQELRNLMYTSQLDSTELPFVIRYPRGEGVMPEWRTPLEAIEIGKGRKLRDGEDVAILSFGHPGNFAKSAIVELQQYGINPGHYDMRFVKPLDEALLHEVFGRYSKIVTIEDGTIVGGFGSAILEFMAQHGYHAQVKMLGIPDRIVEHGSPKELHAECGYDANAIVTTVRSMMQDVVQVATASLLQ